MVVLVDITNRQPLITGPIEPQEAPRTRGASGGASQTPKLLRGPEGLQARQSPASTAGSAPRQKLPPKGDAPTPDADTQSVISEQERQSINSNALALATAKASGIQAMNEFIKSMAEAEAKNIKSSGESIKNLS